MKQTTCGKSEALRSSAPISVHQPSDDLAGSNARELEAVFEAVVDAIIIIDENGRITRVNRAAELMFGYGSGDLSGADVSVLMPEPYHAQHSGYIARYVQTGEPHIIGTGRDLTAKRKDGTQFPIHLSVSRVDHLNAFVGVVRDLTATKERDARLRSAERMALVGSMAAGVAHDIGNVCMAARCGVAVLGRRAIDERGSASLDTLNQAIDALDQLCNSLRRLGRGGSAEESGPVDLRVWWRGHERLFQAAAPSAVRVTGEISEALPAVRVPQVSLTRAVLNMVVNAAEAIGSSAKGRGRITVRAAPHTDGMVRLQVEDDGPGMPPEVCERIFDLFYSTKTGEAASGLGMSMVRDLAVSCGGTVEVRSAPGAGTTIELSMPTVDE